MAELESYGYGPVAWWKQIVIIDKEKLDFYEEFYLLKVETYESVELEEKHCALSGQRLQLMCALLLGLIFT